MDNELLRADIAILKADKSAVKEVLDALRSPSPTTVKQEEETPAPSQEEVEPVEKPPRPKKRSTKSKALVPKQAEVIPKEAEVVEKVPPEVDALLAQFGSLVQLTEIKKKLAKEEFEGKLDPRTLDATDRLKWLDLIEDPPHKTWITAYFINDGPNSVGVGVNYPELKRQEIKKDETLTISQEHADERIRRLFYKCATGETASVRVVGQY